VKNNFEWTKNKYGWNKKKESTKEDERENKHKICYSNLQINIHYERSYSLESHCLIPKAPNQLIYNYIIIRTWKYMQLINKMSDQKIKKLYYNYNLVWNGTPIQYSVHIIHKNIVNHVWFFDKLHYSRVWQLHYNYYKCNTQATTMLWLVYNLSTHTIMSCVCISTIH
jgi:hypothetical protein